MNDDIKLTPLDEYSDEDLMIECMARFDHFVCMGKKDNVDGKDSNEIIFNWCGDDVTCIQMCADLIADVREPDYLDVEDEEED